MNPELLSLVKRINDHVNKFPDNDTGTGQLLVILYDYMEPFRQVMMGTTGAEMDTLCEEYSGFYRLAKLLENMAEGISDGSIDVPKDH